MRRILTAVRSLAPAVIPDILLVAGWLGVALAIAESSLPLLWLAGVPFLIGLAVNADAYIKSRGSRR